MGPGAFPMLMDPEAMRQQVEQLSAGIRAHVLANILRNRENMLRRMGAIQGVPPGPEGVQVPIGGPEGMQGPIGGEQVPGTHGQAGPHGPQGMQGPTGQQAPHGHPGGHE